MITEQFTRLIHPALSVVFVFPLVGIVSHFAWVTRQRRLQLKQGIRTQIAASVGKNHVEIGKWLSATVFIVTLIGLAHPIITKNILKHQLWANDFFQFSFIILMFCLSLASFIFLYQARAKLWRGVFATLSSMGVIILGCQEGVFRRTNEWYWSHYYYGILVCVLMIISVAIVQEIYKDQTLRWRNLHIILNCLALFLFIGQGLTGVRDLFEIGLYTQPPT
jgi:cytochrome c biogenesis factor